MIYPIGIQNFEKIRTEDFLYVDKTAEIYKLAKEGRYYFLSRPRRFGKSLLVSTMEAYFSGRKELFSGLAIEKLETEWKQHSVLHLDLSGVSYTDESVLERVLSDKLAKWETLYGAVNTSDILGLRFKEVIESAYNKTGNQVAILIDEYVQVERTTSNGRIDLIIQTKEFVYLFELKVNADADVALRQIDEKGYARPFEGDSRKLFKIGVNFSTATRRIEDWKIV